MRDDHDFMAELEELERIDGFFDGSEPGDVPIEVLRASGMEIPEDAEALDDEALGSKLREIFRAMFAHGVAFEQTDHLSDRELYRWLLRDGLREETILSPQGGGMWHVSPIGGCSVEDLEIHLRFYADDQDRTDWEREFGGPLPAKEPLPFDRDRFLPQNALSDLEASSASSLVELQ